MGNLIVLILVLMEDTLRERVKAKLSLFLYVLILVLMEDTLRVSRAFSSQRATPVLILVLMEDTLREQRLMFLCIRVFGVCSSF